MIDNYEMIKTISLLLILFSVTIIVLTIVFVHTMPGKIARSRNHPQAEAIEITSLLGLLVFPLWMAALIWAYIKSTDPSSAILKHPDKSDKENPALDDSLDQHLVHESEPSDKQTIQTNSDITKTFGNSGDSNNFQRDTEDSNACTRDKK